MCVKERLLTLKLENPHMLVCVMESFSHIHTISSTFILLCLLPPILHRLASLMGDVTGPTSTNAYSQVNQSDHYGNVVSQSETSPF